MAKLQEDKNIEYLETRYMYESRRKIYIANEETNQVWDQTDIPDVIEAWNNNWSLNEIAEFLGADRWEMELLIGDLIQRGKIQGNVHIFKPKRKGPKIVEIKMDDQVIRIVDHDKQIWVCLKDVWRWIDKPEHSYRKVTEGWGPDRRAKFKMETNGGNQHFIFINMLGLGNLFRHVELEQWEKITRLKGRINNGISSGV